MNVDVAPAQLVPGGESVEVVDDSMPTALYLLVRGGISGPVLTG
jgi:hypothetical protein